MEGRKDRLPIETRLSLFGVKNNKFSTVSFQNGFFLGMDSRRRPDENKRRESFACSGDLKDLIMLSKVPAAARIHHNRPRLSFKTRTCDAAVQAWVVGENSPNSNEDSVMLATQMVGHGLGFGAR